MKSKIYTSRGLVNTQYTTQEQSNCKSVSNPQDCGFSEFQTTRSIPRLMHLWLSSSQNIDQKQKHILSQIIKLCSPQENESSVLDQPFQILISNDESLLPYLAGRLISKDESEENQKSEQFSLQKSVLKSRISRIKQRTNQFYLSKIKSQKSSESFQFPQQNPQKSAEALKKQVETLSNKVRDLQTKLRQKKDCFKQEMMQFRTEMKKKDQMIQKYKETINQLQEQNQKLRRTHEFNSQDQQSFSLKSLLNQKSNSLVFKKAESKILINLSSPNISIESHYSDINQNKNKNKEQTYEAQKQVIKILKKLNKIKSKLSENQKNIFKLKIAQII